MRIPSLILLFCFTLFRTYAQYGTIKGKIYFEEKNKNARASILAIDLRKGIDTDSTGSFALNLPPGNHKLEIHSQNYKSKYININVVKDSIIFLELTLSDSCKYYQTHNRHKLCPICHHKDKVIPIVYGFPIGHLDKENYFYAGCQVTGCDPRWFCKRDNHKF